MHPLIELGVRQFLFLPLVGFSNDFLKELSESRPVADYRKKLAKKEDYILILSQDCDIESPSFQYVEVLVFRKAKSKEASKSSSIEYARNVHKIFVKDAAEFILKKSETSLISKVKLQSELNSLKNEEGIVRFEAFQNENTKSILLAWLVNYYARRPLPDDFNRDLFNGYLKNPEGHPIQQLLLKYANEIIDIHAFVSPMDDEHADKYDVSLTALLHENCSDEQESNIEKELMHQINCIEKDDNKLHMMQSTGESLHDGAIMEVVMRPEDFTRKDDYNTRRLALDFLCWMPKEEEDEP